ncbi:MAG TPA: hypothetical protein VJ044_03425 [Candidatus Hodarchaeales archaeon]|nr:hypothetical protein [Candidatus Hodarchaeales archaeon]
MRGRLIFPFLIDLRRLDTVATAVDPDGVGALASGYDETFKEVEKVLQTPSNQLGVSARKEKAALILPAQIEPEMFDKLEMMISGQSPISKFAVVLHYRDLESNGLVSATTGKPLINKNDRLDGIYNIRTNALIEKIPNPPGLFVVQVQSRSFGLGPDRNLLLLVFEQRDQSIRA